MTEETKEPLIGKTLEELRTLDRMANAAVNATLTALGDALDEAEAAAGFDLAIPDAVDGCSEKQFRAMDADGDKMIEVIYASGEDEIARIRKAPGAEDISGDYNAYAEQTELTSGDAAVTMKGADGLVQLAIWQADGYTYAVSEENGLTADAMAELVAQVR